MHETKQRAMHKIDELADKLVRLSHDIHSHPEVSLTEHKSAGFIADLLRQEGFDVTVGVGGLDTAFVARKTGAAKGPHVAFLAEYDSLPGIGHACGHNVIATCAVGAFLGAAAVMSEFAGTVSVIGTPGDP